MKQFALRLPDDLYDEVAQAAARDGRSMNNYIVQLLMGRAPLTPEDEEKVAELLARPAPAPRVFKRPSAESRLALQKEETRKRDLYDHALGEDPDERRPAPSVDVNTEDPYAAAKEQALHHPVKKGS